MASQSPSQRVTSAPADPARPARADWRPYVVLACEAVVWLPALTGRIGLDAALLGHCAIVALLLGALLAERRTTADKGPALMLLATTAAAGPLGPLVALATLRAPREGGTRPELLDAWYQRIALASDIDPIGQRCDDVALGRTLDLGAAPPASYATVMAAGALAEKQAVLGLIARSFHPDYLGALALALRSPEPVIRVQAAAVATRIRPQLRAEVDALVLKGAPLGMPPAAAQRAAQALRELAGSGLLEEADQRRAEVAADRLAMRAAAGLEALPAVALLRMASTCAPDDAFERLLLERGRFKEFRQLRRIAGIRRRGQFTVRYLRQRRSNAERSRA